MKYPDLNRRNLILSTSAFAVAHPFAALAGGDGGGKDGTASPRKPPKLKERYSQKEYVRLSKEEIRELWRTSNKVEWGGKPVIVEGFSENMSGWLLNLMGYDRTSARRLIKDMGRITDPEKRKARLNEDIERMKRRIPKMKEAKKRAEDNNRADAVEDAEVRIFQAEQYIKAVENWRRFVHEGTI